MFWVGFLFFLRRSFLLTVGSFVAYRKLAWSSLLMVGIRLGRFCLQWKIRLVFCAYSSPCPEIGFGLVFTVPPP